MLIRLGFVPLIGLKPDSIKRPGIESLHDRARWLNSYRNSGVIFCHRAILKEWFSEKVFVKSVKIVIFDQAKKMPLVKIV
jgi:hypothetical protein